MSANNPCTCSGMKLFSAPLDPASLTKAPETYLARNLPTDPTAISAKISGFRDSSLKNSQGALIATALTQQKFDALPEVVKSRPEVMQMGDQLTTMQADLTMKSAQVQALNAQLSNIEEQQNTVLAQKSRMEETSKAEMASTLTKQTQGNLDVAKGQMDATKQQRDSKFATLENAKGRANALAQQAPKGEVPQELANTEQYQSMQSQLDAANQDYATAQKSYDDAQKSYLATKDQVDLYSGQLNALRQGTIPPESMKAFQALPQYQQMQGNLATFQGQYSALEAQRKALQEQYLPAATNLNSLSSMAQSQLPEMSQNIDMLQNQYNLATLSPQQFGMQAGMQGLTKAGVQMPQTFAIPTDASSILEKSLAGVGGSDKFATLTQGQPAFSALSPTATLPGMPAIPAFPQFSPPFPENGMEWIKLPPGLLATPPIPALPAFPGLAGGLPAVPPTPLDSSIASAMAAKDTPVLAQAQKYAGETVKYEDVQAFTPEDQKKKASETKSALTKTPEGFVTPALAAIPPIPPRPALPPLPGTADLTALAGEKIPTLASLQANMDKFSPQAATRYSAIWTNIQAKQAAAQRMSDSMKERGAGFQTSVIGLVDAQKTALADKIPLSRSLAQAGGNPIESALAGDQVPSFLQKYSSLPKTPALCSQDCQNKGIKNLFPDLNSPEQMGVGTFFAGAKDIVSTPGMSVLSMGASTQGLVNSQIANLQSKIQTAGGSVATVTSFDISSALKNPKEMMNLEDKLKGVSMVTLPNMENLTPQESALMADISKKMSASVPVLMTTPSLGSLSTDPQVNTALIGQVAPGGSTVDARKSEEVPIKSVYNS